MAGTRADTTRALLACSGLDHARRGFETFARECFEALSDDPRLALDLIKGSGPPGARERSIPSLSRDAALVKALGGAFGREPFVVEHAAFGVSLMPVIARRRPEVVYLSEWHTAVVLAFLRRASRMEFKIAYCNGATVSEGFGHLDRVQQLTPVALETVLARGADARRHVLLPLGFAIDPRANPVDAQERSALRERLRLPADRRIVLSVAALNRRIKRIDYVIEEVARMPEPRPYLLLLGQPEAETPALRELARSRLGESGHEIRSVRPTEVAGFYRASDLFVLASLGEAFGRALVEAMVQGLPCLAHDYGITRYVLGEHGLLADLSKPGALSGLLASGAALDQTSAEARHRFVYERFSWDRLRPAYVEFLSAAAGRHRSARANNTVSSSTGDAVRTKNR